MINLLLNGRGFGPVTHFEIYVFRTFRDRKLRICV